MQRPRLPLVTTFLALALLWAPATAHAYIDPGSGSFLIQMLLAFLLGLSVTLRMYWQKVKTFVGNLFSRKDTDDEAR